jgi:hypothetical protein
MSDEYGVDLEEVFGVIDGADVLIIRFAIAQQRLLVDFRTDLDNPPYTALVGPVRSVEERVRSIKRVRPSFPYPEKLMTFQWPREAKVLVSSGVWDRIESRIQTVGEAGVEQAQKARDELLAAEEAETMAALRGDGAWKTLWERSAP